MKSRSAVSPEARRLAQVLMHWRGESIAQVAFVAEVDRGNLSRFLSRAENPGLSAAKSAAVLEHLGWSSVGPTRHSVHRWRLDQEADVRWLFSSLLNGSATVSPVLSGSGAADILQHEGLVIAEWQGAWLVLTQRMETGSVPVADTDLLGMLLDERQGLARVSGPYLVEDRRARDRVYDAEDLAPRGLVKLLDAVPDPDIPQQIRDIILKHSELWLTPDRLRTLLEDGLTRLARSEPEELISPLLEELLEYFKDRNQAAPGKSAIAASRRLAEERTAEYAARPFQLDWDTPAKTRKTRSRDS